LELAARLGAPGCVVETHNVYAHVFGGSGIVCLLLMFYCGCLMWGRRLPRWLPPAALVKLQESRRLLRYLLLVWLLRGFFSHEILYSPSFCMAIGLCIGLCLLPAGRSSSRVRRREMRSEYRSSELVGVE
jgi:hypothetical protein